MAFADGTFTSVKQNGITRKSYPFLNSQTKDSTTVAYETDYVVLPASWTPATALMTYPGDGTFSADANAYLVDESQPSDIGGAYTITRKWSRIPSQQVTFASQFFVRPDMHGLKSGSTYSASLDSGQTTHIWTSRTAVLGYTTSQGTSVNNTLPSGNVTITLSDTDSCVFAANASLATIQTAVAGIVNTSPNGLSYVNVVKSSDNSTVTLWYGRWVGGPTVSTVAAPSGVEVGQVSGMIQLKAFGTTVSPDTKLMHVPSHGTSVGASCAIWNGDSLVATGYVSGVGDANYLTIVVSDFDSPDLNITHLSFDDDASARYANGPKMIRTKVIEDFYLPTVSGGITTYDDIPIVSVYDSAQGWLDNAIVGANAYVAIQAGDLEPYAGPIWKRRVVYAKRTSALDSLSTT